MSSRIVPEPEEWIRSSVSLPKKLWARLNTNLDAVNSTRPSPEKLTRDAFLASCIKFALDETEAEANASNAEQKIRKVAR